MAVNNLIGLAADRAEGPDEPYMLGPGLKGALQGIKGSLLIASCCPGLSNRKPQENRRDEDGASRKQRGYT